MAYDCSSVFGLNSFLQSEQRFLCGGHAGLLMEDVTIADLQDTITTESLPDDMEMSKVNTAKKVEVAVRSGTTQTHAVWSGGTQTVTLAGVCAIQSHVLYVTNTSIFFGMPAHCPGARPWAVRWLYAPDRTPGTNASFKVDAMTMISWPESCEDEHLKSKTFTVFGFTDMRQVLTFKGGSMSPPESFIYVSLIASFDHFTFIAHIVWMQAIGTLFDRSKPNDPPVFAVQSCMHLINSLTKNNWSMRALLDKTTQSSDNDFARVVEEFGRFVSPFRPYPQHLNSS